MNNPLKTIALPIGLSIDVIPCDALCISQELHQFRFPKSKKNRIRKKWFKNKKNLKLVKVEKSFCVGNKLYVTERMFEEIKTNPRLFS